MDFIRATFELLGGHARNCFRRSDNVPMDSLDRLEQEFLEEQVEKVRITIVLTLAPQSPQNPSGIQHAALPQGAAEDGQPGFQADFDAAEASE